MTDRYKGFVVTLKSDMRDDDAQAIISAISLITGVISVQPVLSQNIGDAIAEERVRHELIEKMFKVLKEREK